MSSHIKLPGTGNKEDTPPISYFLANSDHYSDQGYDTRQRSLIFFDGHRIIYRTDIMPREGLHITDKFAGDKLCDRIAIEYHNENILPDLLARFNDPGTVQVVFPKGAFIRTTNRTEMFFVDGYIIRLDNNHFLFSFRNIVDEITQEYMLKMALSSTKIFPWFYDFKREAMVIDARYYEYTGIPTKNNTMTLEEFNERIHPDDRASMSEAFERQLSGIHYPYPVPFRLRRGDDSFEWFEGQSTYLGQTEGLPYRIVGICMSTQAFKNIEEALRTAKNKAEQSDQLKSAFLSNMSHEIRTPLNAIVGFSNLLSGEEPIDNEESKEYAALISKNCDYLLTLVSDVLDLSRIETGTMEYSFSEFSVREILKDIYHNHIDHIPESIQFSLHLPDKDIKIESDPLRLRQTLDNLISNAIKFTTEGHIDLGWSLSSDGKHIRISVTDTGKGIPAGHFDKIFERFYKVDSFVQGAGLGLSLCKIMAEQLGGKLLVSSRLKEGSNFTLRIPIRQRETNTVVIH